jgi:ABC-2 type transport system permease protein
MGSAVMGLALAQMGWQFDAAKVAAFLLTFACGTAIAYSFMLMLTSLSVWMVRNQSLMEMWWLFSSVARYPKEIFNVPGAADLMGRFFTYCLPILVVVNVPANAMVRALEPDQFALTLVATVVLLWLSRRFFLHALRSYRSASS